MTNDLRCYRAEPVVNITHSSYGASYGWLFPPLFPQRTAHFRTAHFLIPNNSRLCVHCPYGRVDNGITRKRLPRTERAYLIGLIMRVSPKRARPLEPQINHRSTLALPRQAPGNLANPFPRNYPDSRHQGDS